MQISEIIEKINYFNKIKKERELTDIEHKELQKYRKQYISIFRKNVKNILDNTKVINEKGEDITPLKKGKN